MSNNKKKIVCVVLTFDTSSSSCFLFGMFYSKVRTKQFTTNLPNKSIILTPQPNMHRIVRDGGGNMFKTKKKKLMGGP